MDRRCFAENHRVYPGGNNRSKNLDETDHPDDLPLLIHNVQQINENIPGLGEVRAIHSSGEVRWLRVFGKRAERQDPAIHIIGAAQDITERKQAEQALRRYNDRLEILHKIDNAILSAQSPQEIAAMPLRGIQGLVPCYRASVTLFSDDGRQVHIIALHFAEQTQVNVNQLIPWAEFDWDENLLAAKSPSPKTWDYGSKNHPCVANYLLRGYAPALTCRLSSNKGSLAL